MRTTDVLPLVPVRWTTGYSRSGEPSSSMSGRSRSTASSRFPTPPRAGTPTPVSRLAWASSQARARSTRIRASLGIDERDVDRELVGLDQLELADDPPGVAHVVERRLERAQQLGRRAHDRVR